MSRSTRSVELRIRFAAIVAVWLVTLMAAAWATPSGWRGGGGVTDPADYADYNSAIVGNEYQTDIEQATELGIVIGHDDHTFRPDDNVTVGQFANIIARNYWQQGAGDDENLDYLGSLGIDVSSPDAALTLEQLSAVADAVQSQSGVADLAILEQVRDGNLVPSGAGGGITRGQAVDIAAQSQAGSSGGTYVPKPPPKTPPTPKPPSPPPDPPDPPHPPAESPTLSAVISPNPARRQQMITLIATVTRMRSVSAQLPWQNIDLSGSGATRTGSTCVPADLVDGTYLVVFRGISTKGNTLQYSLELTIRGSILDDLSFVITD